MDLDALGNIGDFVGGLAVIASLLYLARQINQNTASVRESALSAYLQANIEQNRLMVQDDEVSRIFWEGLASRQDLTLPERRRFDALINIVFRTYQHAFELGSHIFSDHKSNIASGAIYLLRTAGVSDWWCEYRATYSPDFVAYVDALLVQIENEPGAAQDAPENAGKGRPAAPHHSSEAGTRGSRSETAR